LGLSSTTFTSILYNQGITFDQARRDFYFDGVTSTSNSGLNRTDSDLSLTAADFTVIPGTTEGFNHAGDLSFDPIGRRILLPLECFYPANGGNTCGVGGVGPGRSCELDASARRVRPGGLPVPASMPRSERDAAPDGRADATPAAARSFSSDAVHHGYGYALAMSGNVRIERGWIFVDGTRQNDGTIKLGTGGEMRFSPFDAISQRQDAQITWGNILTASVQRLAFWRR
jgi:hypothetical protein